MNNYDLIILGAGAAGLTAQLYGLRYNMKILTIGGIVGGLLTEAYKICNWPGEISISGQELIKKMQDQIRALDGEILLDQAAAITKIDNGWQVETVSKKSFTAKAILLALGTVHRKLGVEGEEHFTGRGVAYCATCDGMFYKGKTVAVVGGGNSATTAALYLADICPKVYLLYRGEELKGEVAWIKELEQRPNIVKLPNTQVTGLKGETKLEKIILDKPWQGQSELAVDGLFVEIGVIPKVDLFKAAGGEVDEQGHIKVKADQSTNLSGVWAAGDGTNGSNNFRQLVTAASEGAIAADSIFKFVRSSAK
jgi:thioredoxin reductase (NADPH)